MEGQLQELHRGPNGRCVGPTLSSCSHHCCHLPFVQELEHDIAVLRQKIDVDAKLTRHAAQVAAKEREHLRRQLVVSAANLEDKVRGILIIIIAFNTPLIIP